MAFLSLILFWKRSRNTRLFLAIAFLIAVLGDVITFSYFYPRNDMLMNLPIQGNTDRIITILKQWRFMELN
ncbi:MAG: hypothetical protein ABI288_11790 [Ginsengibacter sp.]